MGVSSPKRSIPGGTAAQATLKQTEDVHKTGADTPTAAEPSIPVEKAPKMASNGQEQGAVNMETKTQVQASTAASETNTTLSEPEQEQEAAMHTPEKDEELSVISSDVSPHDSDFDFLQINTDTGFSLLTPSPCRRRSLSGNLELEMGPVASPPLSGASSIACSPSRFFKSPLVTSAASRRSERRTVRTPQRRTIVPMRLTTPKRLLDAINSISEQEEKEMTPIQEETEGKPQQQVTGARPPRQASTSATPPRTPARQQPLSRRLQDVFDRSDDKEGREVNRGALKAPSVTSKKVSMLLDADDIHCVPSGLMTSPSEHDSFFSFANSLSPLMPAEEFDHSFMAVKLSPLVSLSSYELPRLLPPFPEQDQDDGSPTGLYYNTPTILKTPQNKKRGVSPAESLAGGCISAPGSASAVVSPGFFSDSFPNILASTSATPGKDERSKLGGHSVMKMKLHTSFGAFDSHPTREMQAINNSLKRKKYVRRRKAEERQEMKPSSSSSNVQRKLLQTPVKTSASPRTRSPLHQWNGQTSPATMFKTPTPRKLAPAQRLNLTDAPSYAPPPSPPVARKLIPASEPTAAPYTPVINQKKRKATQCVSMPSSMANLSSIKMRKSPLGARQPVGVAVTPAKQIKREVSATPPGKYTLLTPQNNRGAVGMPSLDGSMFKTPTPIGSTTSLKMSLQSASKAPLVPGVMPAQVPKKAPCNCKKSKCLKLYCECFASGGYCDESCNCQDCANTTAKEDVRQQAIAARLEKNPNAFKPKIGATAAMVTLTPGSARRLSASGGSRSSTGSFVSPPGQLSNQQQHLLGAKLVTTKMHKHGCHCKKSACQKKYCECFQAGVPCGENCRCIDCKNQAPCVAHANGMTTPDSALGGTPARIANELDETFVSPVLRTVRQHLRIDRETWTKNFASPFEASPGREKQRTELLRTRLVASTGAVDTIATPLGVRVRAAPFTSPPTPQMASRIGVKRPRDVSPTRGESDEQRERALTTGSLLKQYAFADKAKSTVGRAVLSAVASSSAGAERVFVLPLFGAKLPPLESGVSATIFRFLTNADLHNASLVSHLWNQVALGDIVWDHANFIPTEANVAASQHLQTKKLLLTPDRRNTDKQMVALKREPDLSVLSALR